MEKKMRKDDQLIKDLNWYVYNKWVRVDSMTGAPGQHYFLMKNVVGKHRNGMTYIFFGKSIVITDCGVRTFEGELALNPAVMLASRKYRDQSVKNAILLAGSALCKNLRE